MYSVLDVLELHHDQPPYRRPRDALWELLDEEDDVICESVICEFSRPSDNVQPLYNDILCDNFSSDVDS